MVSFLALFFLVSLLLVLSFYLSISSRTLEKVSVYECGFDPYSDARLKFDIIYYLVAILFLIFDLEIIFLFPFSALLFDLSFSAFWVYLIFFVVLTIGYLYELNSGSLDL
uniref:NADH-ubiquinone oxidoreductase chain 3 n=1 Tax=Harpochytrium sp. JEL94 TaxID=109764 RepID=Q85JC3_9FUNG|nr:NADH dehydrogenase subunit 3 [Harpochytrium sp. JEL94]AAO62890.1 NADH dehydrogenase subunit 3 [Harpochytrium sp. JEL94]